MADQVPTRSNRISVVVQSLRCVRLVVTGVAAVTFGSLRGNLSDRQKLRPLELEGRVEPDVLMMRHPGVLVFAHQPVVCNPPVATMEVSQPLQGSKVRVE